MGEEDVRKKWLLVVADLIAGKEHCRATVKKRLGQSLSTADRLIDDIREALPQVQLRHDGKTKWISLPKRRVARQELVAACVMASMGRIFRGSEHERSLANLRDALLDEAGARYADLERKFFLHRRGGELALPEAGKRLDLIVDAILRTRRLRIEYSGLNGRRDEHIEVEPLSLVVFEHQFYLLARRQDGSYYPFRFARINGGEIGHESFTYPSKGEFAPQAILEAGFGMHVAGKSPPEHVEVELTGKWATYALTHRWHPSQQVAPQLDGQTALVTLRVALCPELETWILSFGEFARVLGPPKLRAAIMTRLRTMSKLYPEAGFPSVAKTSGKHAKSSRGVRRRGA